MEYREHTPHPSLSPFIRCYWTLRGAMKQPAAPTRVFPDGAMEIIFHFAEPFQLLDDGVVRGQASTLLAGQICAPITLLPSASCDVLGIRFHPGGTHPFLRFPQNLVAGRIVNLQDHWGRLANDISDALGESQGVKRIQILERYLLAMKPQAQESRMSLSLRQYRRRFEAEVGLPPKLFERIQRFQGALQRIGREPLVDIALECGYYDQAHLIRDFRQFTGNTPSQWLRGQEDVLFFQDAVQQESLF